MGGLLFDRISFLIADDNAHMRRLIRFVLRSFHANDIREAEGGEHAFKELCMQPADILLTDYHMRRGDGLELAQRIRKDEDSPNHYMPVIMVSAYSDLSHVLTARDSGVNEFLVKPISANGLYSRICSVIEHPRHFVRVGDYFGPDRRRRAKSFDGKDRRGAGGGERVELPKTPTLSQDQVNELFHPDGPSERGAPQR